MKKQQHTQKQKVAILKSSKKIGVKEAAKIAGVHYTTVYEWKKKYEALGEKEFLKYKPLYPGRGIKEIKPDQEKSILETWKNNPGFGPGQVRNQLRRQGITISIKTIRNILSANGYKASGKKNKSKTCTRFEASRPLELTQMDILEFFINKLKVYLILLLDDFSRFILNWKLLEETSVDDVICLVRESVERYGKMEELLTDRGFVFYSWRGINRFEKYLELERIDHTHARPHHPQTLGKVEACNRRVKNELIRQRHFANIKEAQLYIGKWVEHYNYSRTHQGIGGLLVPGERFHGRSDQVLESIAKGIGMGPCFSTDNVDIDRSVLNIVYGNDGNLTLYLMGHPVNLTGGGKIA